MNFTNEDPDLNLVPLSAKLAYATVRLRGISYLMEHQAPNIEPPSDWRLVHAGISSLLNDLVQELNVIRKKLVVAEKNKKLTCDLRIKRKS